MSARLTLTRTVLLAPGAVARAASMLGPPEQRWMLSQPRPVRASYVRDVLDYHEEERRQRRWMLRQHDDVRESYIRAVLARASQDAREEIWMLRQGQATRESYVAEVLDPEIEQATGALEDAEARLSRADRTPAPHQAHGGEPAAYDGGADAAPDGGTGRLAGR